MNLRKSILGLLFFTVFSMNAQGDAGSLIQGGIADGEKLLDAYLLPINKAIVFGLSDVTYTKFKDNNDTKKLSVAIKLAYISIPSEDLTYDISKLNLQTMEAKDPTQTIAQTVFGDSIKSITIASKSHDLLGRPLYEFQSPTGSGNDAMPLPTLGITYRLDKTNISVSLIPFVKVPESTMSIGMFGLGVQQDVASFVKALEDKPFHVSIQGNFAILTGKSDLDVKPEGVTVPITASGTLAGPYTNQEVKINYTSLQLGTYVDYTISDNFSLFGGIAYNSGTSNIDVTGTYPIYGEDPTHTGAVVATDIDDPVSLNQSFNRMKYELGAQLDFNSLYLQVNYNIATYGGVGFNLGYKFL